jgi:hypothetical protein
MSSVDRSRVYQRISTAQQGMIEGGRLLPACMNLVILQLPRAPCRVGQPPEEGHVQSTIRVDSDVITYAYEFSEVYMRHLLCAPERCDRMLFYLQHPRTFSSCKPSQTDSKPAMCPCIKRTEKVYRGY